MGSLPLKTMRSGKLCAGAEVETPAESKSIRKRQRKVVAVMSGCFSFFTLERGTFGVNEVGSGWGGARKL